MLRTILLKYNTYLRCKNCFLFQCTCLTALVSRYFSGGGSWKPCVFKLWYFGIFLSHWVRRTFTFLWFFWSHALGDPFDLNKFKRDLAPPGTARRSLAWSGLVLHVLALGVSTPAWADGHWHGEGELVTQISWTDSWHNPPDTGGEGIHSHTHRRTHRSRWCLLHNRGWGASLFNLLRGPTAHSSAHEHTHADARLVSKHYLTYCIRIQKWWNPHILRHTHSHTL